MGGKRGPLIAGVATAVVVLLVAVVLVLPKLGQVKDANDALTQAQSQQGTLASQLAALKQAQVEAPKNRETIRKVEQAIPPTVDQQGFILLVQNAALQSSVDVATVTPSNPVFDPTSGLSTVTNGLSVSGSYFAITEFLFQLETLPRAAIVTSVSLSPGSTGTGSAASSQITLTASVNVFTSDTSAGPASTPGPTTTGGGTATAPTTPTTSSTASPAAITTGA